MSDWKQVDKELSKGYKERQEAMTPEPLFESYYMPKRHVCLRCGKARATSLLYTPMGMRPVLPMCKDCATDWNWYGYYALKRIQPKSLIWNLIKFKFWHPFSRPSGFDLYRDIRNMLRWVRKMRHLKTLVRN